MSVSNDKEILISIVHEMTKSRSGLQSTKHWAEDALWYDIPPFASRGIPPAIKMFDNVFSSFKSCEISILDTDTFISNDMGIVCTVQKVDIVFMTGIRKSLIVRETDCFQKSGNGEWRLIHQHASVPSGGDWDGIIVTA